MVIVNKSPIVRGHVLFCPKQPKRFLAELEGPVAADLWHTVHTLSPSLSRIFGATSRTIALQDGPEAGQSVEHVHIHWIPRRGGDFARNDDVYTALEQKNTEKAMKSTNSMENPVVTEDSGETIAKSVEIPVKEGDSMKVDGEARKLWDEGRERRGEVEMAQEAEWLAGELGWGGLSREDWEDFARIERERE
jgi:diadenosine tetraphosphate (Ap4A) HIT family hydrolase